MIIVKILMKMIKNIKLKQIMEKGDESLQDFYLKKDDDNYLPDTEKPAVFNAMTVKGYIAWGLHLYKALYFSGPLRTALKLYKYPELTQKYLVIYQKGPCDHANISLLPIDLFLSLSTQLKNLNWLNILGQYNYILCMCYIYFQ